MKKYILTILVLSLFGCSKRDVLDFDSLKHIVDDLNIVSTENYLLENKFYFNSVIPNEDDGNLASKPIRKLYKSNGQTIEVSFYNNEACGIVLTTLSIEPYLKISKSIKELNYHLTESSNPGETDYMDVDSNYHISFLESKNENNQPIYVISFANRKRNWDNQALQEDREIASTKNDPENLPVKDTINNDEFLAMVDTTDTYDRYFQFVPHLKATDDHEYKALFSGTLSYVSLEENIIEVKDDVDGTYQTLGFYPIPALVSTMESELVLGRKIKCLVDAKGEVKQIDFIKN